MWKPSGHLGSRRRAQIHLVRLLSLSSFSVSGGSLSANFVFSVWEWGTCSLQFDPAPRAGEPLVSRRPPDYCSFPLALSWCLLISDSSLFSGDQQSCKNKNLSVFLCFVPFLVFVCLVFTPPPLCSVRSAVSLFFPFLPDHLHESTFPISLLYNPLSVFFLSPSG